jgi:uncharacterized protein (TIGR03067 family)
MRLLVPLLLIALPLWAAPAPFIPRKLTAEEVILKALQGHWEIVEGNERGCTAAITGRGMICFVDGKLSARVSIALGPPDQPRAMDLIFAGAPSGGDRLRCIYELEGDTLRIASLTEGDSDRRPAGFGAAKAAVWVYKRKKP